MGVTCLEVGGGHCLHDPDHLRLETEINHPIGLIEHDIVALIEHSIVLGETIDQPPGGGHNNLAPSPQLAPLLLDGLSSNDRDGLEAAKVAELDGLLLNLLSELSSGGEDDRVRSVCKQGSQSVEVT